MSGHSAEEIKAHTKVYWFVFFALLALTAVTVGASYLHVEFHWALLLCLVIASTKASLVGGYFMHLIGEKKIIFSVLLLTLAFFIFVLLLPTITDMDSTGTWGIWSPK